MELRQRRVAQIVRDFMDSYVLSSLIGERLARGELEFADVDALAAESERSVLYRLKEECHALFRVDAARSHTHEVQAEELFDLAVGALFHETMKFREGYYTTTTYGPRLKRMMAEGGASGPLVEAFQRVLEAGRRRMLESEAEAAELFRETRDQLRIVLRQTPGNGAIARSLVEDPARAERVFDEPLDALLADIYGSAARGYELAVESLIENGHYAEAEAVASRAEVRGSGACDGSVAFARGMSAYLIGEVVAAVDLLEQWAGVPAQHGTVWVEQARRVLRALVEDAPDPALRARAGALADRLSPPPRDSASA